MGAGQSRESMAHAERISLSYVHHILRLTLLAPFIVEAIVSGNWLPAVRLRKLNTLPAEWTAQRRLLQFNG